MIEKSIEQERNEPVADADPETGQPIEEAEDNLSRHSTKNSSPPVEEQGRTTEPVDRE
ncbi:MAG TPA: hypothetical protein VM911_19650 [Pyrinomonadaceae bacterium]|jgi:hypothetical protein|nr:hypothetical protein [Pyrinomonadaceae bacterium]